MSKILLYIPRRFTDDRGWFTETFNNERERDLGIDELFVQDNESCSVNAGTIRGIHFQRPPYAQAKLVRCTSGSLIDIVVDLRRGSPTFGKYLTVELSAHEGQQLFVPVGFGHAFITSEANTKMSYKVTSFYSADADGGVRWDSPEIGIEWPLPGIAPTISAKDNDLPILNDLESPFEYDGLPLELVRVGGPARSA